jgi:hypothetical protein
MTATAARRVPWWAVALAAVIASVLGATVSWASPTGATATRSHTYDSASHVSSERLRALSTPGPASLTTLRSPAPSAAQPHRVAAPGVAAEGALPELSASRSALEAKFKHAGDFGVTEGRGAAGFDAYGKAIDSFVGDSATTRVLGTYRGDPAILNYNANTAQVVVQGVDGSFISGWQMSPAQLQNVIERGSLGGG